MSSVPPDEPTRPLRPAAPAPAPAPGPVYAADPAADAAYVEAQRSSAAAGWALALAALALIAAIVAIFLVQRDDDNGSAQRGVSAASFVQLREDVRDLGDRVDKLNGDVGAAKDAGGDAQKLGDQVDNLQKDLDSAADAQDKLSQRVEDLEKRLDEVEQQQQEQAASQPEESPTP